MYLTQEELKGTYYKKAAAMDQDEVKQNLARANGFAQGVIGGPLPAKYLDDSLKAAVAMAFEIMTRDETGQVDPTNGNITEAAPAGYFAQKNRDPLDVVRGMLLPYAEWYEQLQKPNNDKGVRFY